MTLDEAKTKVYEIYMTQISAMNDMIEHPEDLRACGYKTMEQYLITIVKYTHKNAERIFREYERTNPD